MIIRLLSALAYNGETLDKGNTVSLNTSEAQDLAAKGHAEAILIHTPPARPEPRTDLKQAAMQPEKAVQSALPGRQDRKKESK